ncbi:MAG: UPF0182 family protein [Gemmatimonadaceae bacterium]|nr:UPF0182 family protein [Gemmatimonadaceae bacterium]
MSGRSRRGLLAFVLGGALALLAGRWAAGLYAERAFFHALGLHGIWHAKVTTLTVLGFGTFLVAGLFAFANLYAVRQSIVSLVLPRQVGDLELAEAIPTARLTIVAIVLSVAIAALFALLPHDWHRALLAWDGVSFGEREPYLERDLGFYVAWLPFERAVQERVLLASVGVGMLACVLYALTPSVRWGPSGLYVSTWVRRHLSALAGLLVLLVGWDWRLDRYERLADGSGVTQLAEAAGLFTLFDHRIAQPYLAVASFASIPVAAVLVWAGWRGYLRLGLALLSALILGGPMASALLPAVAKRTLARPASQRLERSYVTTSALFTRRAFGVDAIAGGDTVVVPSLALRDLATQVSAWDPAALAALDERAGAPAIISWRAAAAGLEALRLTPGSPAGVAAQDWSGDAWTAAAADEAGRPYLAPGIVGARLRHVVVSPGAGAFAVVPDSSSVIRAPAFASTLDRLALAWDLQDPRLLFRDLPSPRPVLVTPRDVRARLRRALPFLAAGPTITPLVRGDSLYWVVDLFVAARRYPLSQPVTADGAAVHYAQLAATAFVHAQTGGITTVPVDAPDPVLRQWMQRFPDAFTPLAGAPGWMRTQRPPSVDRTRIQGAALARVGFQRDSVATRRLARPDDADVDLAEGAPSFFQYDSVGTLGWAVPLDLPRDGRTLGLLISRGGPERRTEYLASPGPSWTAMLERLQRAADEAGFGRTLPAMRRGRVQAIPVDGSLALVQSYYAWPDDDEPRLAGVVVLVGDSVRAGRTLAETLGMRVTGRPMAPDAFRERVARLYDAMQSALRAGDWRAYGDAWAALGSLLRR